MLDVLLTLDCRLDNDESVAGSSVNELSCQPQGDVRGTCLQACFSELYPVVVQSPVALQPAHRLIRVERLGGESERSARRQTKGCRKLRECRRRSEWDGGEEQDGSEKGSFSRHDTGGYGSVSGTGVVVVCLQT